MKNGVVLNSRKTGHRRFNVPVEKTRASESELKARRALAADLLAQGKTPSAIGVVIADEFKMDEQKAKKWVYNNHKQLRSMKPRKEAAASPAGPADAVNDVSVPRAVRDLPVGKEMVHAVSIPLVTAQRCALILKREVSKGDKIGETIETLEDAIARAIGL